MGFRFDQHLVHLRIAHAFADSESASVDAFRARHQCSHRIGNRQATVAVSVPVHANLFPGRFHHFFEDKAHQRECAHGRRMSGGIANHDGARAATDCSRIQTLDHDRIAAGCVFGYVHAIESERDTVRFHRLLGGLEEKIIQSSLRCSGGSDLSR